MRFSEDGDITGRKAPQEKAAAGAPGERWRPSIDALPLAHILSPPPPPGEISNILIRHVPLAKRGFLPSITGN